MTVHTEEQKTLHTLQVVNPHYDVQVLNRPVEKGPMYLAIFLKR